MHNHTLLHLTFIVFVTTLTNISYGNSTHNITDDDPATSTTTTPTKTTTTPTTKLLLLGGNGLLGSAAVSAILNSAGSSGFEVTLLSRGNWYWDTEKLIKPFVHHIKCTRGEGFRESCTRLQMGQVYDTIVDFSSYDPLDVEVSRCS